MEPTDIKIIDPCMGSGHILVYAFDVLIQIYESYGYSKQDAASLIVENNIFGLDIDERAYQLAYFAVMMEARGYDPNIFNRNLKPNLYAMVETSDMDDSCLDGYGKDMSPEDKNLAYSDVKNLLSLFKDARTYGSLIKVCELDFNRISNFLSSRSMSIYADDDSVRKIVAIAKILSQKYDAVITNPPYMGSNKMDSRLSSYVKNAFPDSKSDLFACFIDRCMEMTAERSFTTMITMHSFMYLSSFEKFRSDIIRNRTIVNMAHQGAHGFNQIGGEVVQTVAFTFCNNSISNYSGTYIRLVDEDCEETKELKFLSGENRFYVKQSRFNAIPGAPIAYWISDKLLSSFIEGKLINDVCEVKTGLSSGDNGRFVRNWYEVSLTNIKFNCISSDNSVKCIEKWYPYNCGGEYRKWYGNDESVVNWKNDGYEIRNFKDLNGKPRSYPRSTQYYFKEMITWSKLSSGVTSFRYKPCGFVFGGAGGGIFSSSNSKYLLGFCNSIVASKLASAISPTLNYEVGHIASFPIIEKPSYYDIINQLVDLNIKMSKEEWDLYEISWNYDKDPLIMNNKDGLVQTACINYNCTVKKMFQILKNNEETLNKLFIEIYGLNEEINPCVDDKYVSIRIPTCKQMVSNLISYSVGCMFGRYSLDKKGLINAGGNWIDVGPSFEVDPDNIIPINDNEYFGDDIVVKFVNFIKVVFGGEHLEENLKFIADNLEIKYTGTSRDGIRKYFLNNFYDDHVKMYQKCPIYWLFDSGKENGFKALIYMHRYTPDLIPKMRQDYLLPMMNRYNEQLKSAEGTERIQLQKKIEEVRIYDIAMEKYASDKVSIDLDDGVKVNYAKFQDIDNPGSKKKINLLHLLK